MPRITRTNLHEVRLDLLAEELGSTPPATILGGVCASQVHASCALLGTLLVEA